MHAATIQNRRQMPPIFLQILPFREALAKHSFRGSQCEKLSLKNRITHNGEAGKDFLLGFFFCPETIGQERNIFSFVIDFREVKMQ